MQLENFSTHFEMLRNNNYCAMKVYAQGIFAVFFTVSSLQKILRKNNFIVDGSNFFRHIIYLLP